MASAEAISGKKVKRKQRGDFMGELYEPFPRLPKNIRQIGERDQVLRLYVEDYVNTYLKRLQPVKGADLRVGLLLGSRENHEGVPYVFVDGALEMETTAREGEGVVFDEEAWKKAYQEVEKYFPKRTVQGWFLCGNQGCSLSPLTYWKQHSQYFTGKNQLMYLNSGLEGEENVYITSSDGFYRLRGYCVYYERNQMMQDYMILKTEPPKSETGVDDGVIQDFRQRMEENRSQAGKRRSAVGMLSGVCAALAITVLAGGVAMFGNYRKMRQMESVVASVLPFKAGEEGFSFREVMGNIKPAKADTAESLRESPVSPVSETFPGAASETQPGAFSGTFPEAVSETAIQGDNEDGAVLETERGSGESGGILETAAGKEAGTAAEDKIEPETPEQTAAAAKTPEQAAASAQTPPAAPVSSANYQVYQVEEGDTLYGICLRRYENLAYIDEICRVNGLTDINNIISGQKLLVP